MINYKASPTIQRFFDSRAFVKILQGPVGGGKSTGALMDLLQRAVSQEPFNNVRRTKFGILRNTREQLKATVKPLIDTWFVTLTNSRMGEWRLQDNTFEAKFRLPDNTIVHTEFCLLAADTPDDVRRLLSLELSAGWVEEAREIDPEVFEGFQGRTARFPSMAAGGVTYPGVVCSMNPPPKGGYWHQMVIKPPKNTEVFLQPPALLDDGTINPEAENLANLHPAYYENLVEGKSKDWIDVYLKNMFGPGDYGRPIFSGSFSSAFHVAKTHLMPIMQSLSPLIVGLDNGLQAAAVICQQDMRGRVNVLGEAYVPENTTMSVERFLDTIFQPYFAAKFPQISRENVLFVMDPACFQRSQVDEKTIAMAVAIRGWRAIKANSNSPELRQGAVEGLLARQIDGEPGFRFDPDCTHIIESMEWGYRYKKNGQTPDKTHHSHINDALQYAALQYSVYSGTGGVIPAVQKREVQKRAYRYT